VLAELDRDGSCRRDVFEDATSAAGGPSSNARPLDPAAIARGESPRLARTWEALLAVQF
jgi:hypothetical protein